MATIPHFRRVRACQYTGANAAEMTALCNSIEVASSSGNVWTTITATGSLYEAQSMDQYGVQANFITVPVNTWIAFDNFVLVVSSASSAVLADRYISYNDAMAVLVTAPAFTSAVAAAATAARTVDNAAARSVVTGTGATGFQLSASRGAEVNYKVQTSTTATIGGASTATAVLEIAPTNSATPGDWKEIGRVSNSQTITLAVALQSVQVMGGSLVGYVPAGYYAKIRSVTSGTASVTYLTGQEILL